MNNQLAAISILICSVALAGAAVYTELQNGDYTPSEAGTIRQAAPPQLTPDSNFTVSAYPLRTPDLAPGEGSQETRAYCNACHSPNYILMQPPLPAATWEAEVNKMNKTFGAGIPDEDTKKIIQYLSTHYTPDTRKP